MHLKQSSERLKEKFIDEFERKPFRPCRLFLSATDMKSRAVVRHASDIDPAVAFDSALDQLINAIGSIEPTILRADWVVDAEAMTWEQLLKLIGQIRRNYFKPGIALSPDFSIAFTECELNANLMLYDGNNNKGALNIDRANAYCRTRFNRDFPALKPDAPVVVFNTGGAFVIDGEEPQSIDGAEHRRVSPIDPNLILSIARSGANHLARQIQDDGRFVYGLFPCDDRIVPSYNSLRHFSSIFAMLDVYETYLPDERNEQLRQAIIRGIDYAVKKFVRWIKFPDGNTAAFIEEPSSKEFKLGALGVPIVTLAKFTDVMRTPKYLPLMNALARGIITMQKPDGSFVHVLNSTDLSIKEPFRIVYYDGEAVFGLMRLYSFTREPWLLEAAQSAFDRFIATDHWKHHDHWLSYAVNELTKYDPRPEYFEFGIKNFIDHLRFIYHRDTQYPTLMELMMAADTMLERMKSMPEMSSLLSTVNFEDFYAAMEARAANMLNGYFYPEFAMYFARPESINGTFFMRHHEFRARNDDIEHFLSGFVAYRRYLARRDHAPQPSAALISNSATPIQIVEPVEPVEDSVQSVEPVQDVSDSNNTAEIFFGGDVVLARRMHWRVNECRQFGNIPAMINADLRIVNLECVISTLGEQGQEKGEGGPFYFHGRPELLNILNDAGIEVVLTANNHPGDYGRDAVLDHVNYLDKAGLIHCGAGANIDEASKPVFVKVKDLSVAIFSVDATMKYFASTDNDAGTWYLPPKDIELWRKTFTDKIADARKHADVVIVAPHWGLPNIKEPLDYMKTLGRVLIDCGADAVLGCHSHNIHYMEKYNERPIVYDTGDFLFETRGEHDACGLSLTIDRDGVKRLRFIPLRNGYGYVVPATRSRDRINNWFAELCRAAGTEVEIRNGAVEMDLNPAPRGAETTINRSNDELIIAPSNMEHHRIEPLNEPRPEWIVDKVPDDAIIGPRALGPLLMVGYRVPPECRTMNTRRMLYVETYWKLNQPFEGKCSALIEARPIHECNMAPYGNGMEHDLCDWMWPVNRWKPGVIYREKFGLRAPDLKRISNVPLQIQIRLNVNGKWFGPFKDPHLIELQLPHAPHFNRTFPDIIYRSKPGQCWNAEQIRQVTGGRWLVVPPDDWFANSIVRGRNSMKELPAPHMFVVSTPGRVDFHEGNKADRVDTHGILKRVADRTVGAIVERYVEGLPPNYPQLLVEDPIKAGIELGFAARRRFNGKVIAITGTVGKSSVTDMLKFALQHRKFIATVENYNSRVGVPLLLASLARDYDYAIVEIAMSALWMNRGPITDDINPDVSIITQIGMSQTISPSVRSLDDIIKVKAKVFQGMADGGVAVYHDQLEGFDYVRERATKYAARQIVCGSSDNATSKILDIKDVENGHEVRAEIEGEAVQFKVTPYGMASVMNMMLVLGALKAVGEDIQAAVERLNDYQPMYGRLEYNDVEFDGKNVRVIDDSWNAEVLSFKRALTAAPHMKKPNGRMIGVLGRIVNLGKLAPELHRELRDPIVETNFDYIVTHGPEMIYLREVLPKENLGPHFENAQELVEHLKTVLRDDDTILIKGSRRDSDFGTIGLILIGKQ